MTFDSFRFLPAYQMFVAPFIIFKVFQRVPSFFLFPRIAQLSHDRISDAFGAPVAPNSSRPQLFSFSTDSEQNEADGGQLRGGPRPPAAPPSPFTPLASCERAPADPSQGPLPGQPPITHGGQWAKGASRQLMSELSCRPKSESSIKTPFFISSASSTLVPAKSE